MKQSSWASWIETCTNTFVGFGLSLFLQWLYFDYFLGFPLQISANFIFALVMTVVSLARGFGVRRLFEKLHIRIPLSPAMIAVVAERRRQFEIEGWSTDHDDKYPIGELARAGAAYLLSGTRMAFAGKKLWPWSRKSWKPSGIDPRRDLVRGLALGVAELEKYDRASKIKTPAADNK